MGFCSDEEYHEFRQYCASFERTIVRSGILLIKYFLDVDAEIQRQRFSKRINDPRRHWKLSPMDLESISRWWDYTQAYNDMFAATDTEYAPWYVVDSNRKRNARLNCISHLLSLIPYEKIRFEPPKLPRHQREPDEVMPPMQRSIR